MGPKTERLSARRMVEKMVVLLDAQRAASMVEKMVVLLDAQRAASMVEKMVDY